MCSGVLPKLRDCGCCSFLWYWVVPARPVALVAFKQCHFTCLFPCASLGGGVSIQMRCSRRCLAWYTGHLSIATIPFTPSSKYKTEDESQTAMNSSVLFSFRLPPRPCVTQRMYQYMPYPTMLEVMRSARGFFNGRRERRTGRRAKNTSKRGTMMNDSGGQRARSNLEQRKMDTFMK